MCFFSFCDLPKNLRIKIHKSIILTVALCGSPLPPMEEYRLSTFETKVLRRMFESKREEVLTVMKLRDP
jgi:hypothetical protein